MLDDLVAAGGERIDFCAAGSVKSNMGGMWRESSLAAGEGIGTILASRPLIEHTVRRRALEKQLISLRSRGERVAGLLGGNVTGVRLSTGEEITSELTVDGRCQRPRLSVADARVTYADALMRPPPGYIAASGWRVHGHKRGQTHTIHTRKRAQVRLLPTWVLSTVSTRSHIRGALSQSP